SWNSQLVAAGTFRAILGSPFEAVATWNGIDWQQLGEGLDGSAFTLGLYDDELYVSGDIRLDQSSPRIAVYRSSSWQSVGEGLSDWSSCFTVFDESLIAGGAFDVAGKQTANGLASWNGQVWRPFGDGLL